MKNTMNEMVMNERELDMVNGGMDSYYLKHTATEYAESGVTAEVIADGKSYSSDRFRNVRGYKVTFSMIDAQGVSHEVNSGIAEKAIEYQKTMGKPLSYEDIYTPADVLMPCSIRIKA